MIDPLKWEPWKVLAAAVVVSLVYVGLVIALAKWLPRPAQTITVHVFIERQK